MAVAGPICIYIAEGGGVGGSWGIKVNMDWIKELSKTSGYACQFVKVRLGC